MRRLLTGIYWRKHCYQVRSILRRVTLGRGSTACECVAAFARRCCVVRHLLDLFATRACALACLPPQPRS